MRLYAYADKFGRARTGVLEDDGLLTAKQLSRHLKGLDWTSGCPCCQVIGTG